MIPYYKFILRFKYSSYLLITFVVFIQYKVLNPSGTYAREEVLLAMLQGQGQEEAAREKLNKTVLQPFFDRIWEGIDQEGSRNGIVTGGRLLQQAASDTCLSVSTSVISHEDFQQAVLDKNIDKEVSTRRYF